MARLDDYLRYAMEQRASDIHFSADEPIRMRIDGDLIAIDDNRLSSEEIDRLFDAILTETDREKLTKNKNLDKSHLVEGVGNFRVNVFFMKRGIGAVIRSIPSRMPTMQELGLPATIQQLADLPKGLVLVTGPTGSGKSTTLAAILNHINETCPYHILTVEDPVEFVHPPKMSLVNQREIGENCHSFADALKYALREDPDVILVGEMRDLETIALALTAAETGHLVFGTLHTRGAGASVDRIIDSFPANQQGMVRAMLAESLAAVISQALLKKKDGKGRVAAYEIMVVNHAISNLIREGKTFQIPSILQTSKKDGMMLMSQHMKELVEKGIVAEEEIAAYLDEGPGQTGKAKSAGKPAPKFGASLPPMKASATPAAAPAKVPSAAAPPAAPKAATPPPPAAKLSAPPPAPTPKASVPASPAPKASAPPVPPAPKASATAVPPAPKASGTAAPAAPPPAAPKVPSSAPKASLPPPPAPKAPTAAKAPPPPPVAATPPSAPGKAKLPAPPMPPGAQAPKVNVAPLPPPVLEESPPLPSVSDEPVAEMAWDKELTPPSDDEAIEPSFRPESADAEPGSFAPLDLVAESDGQVEPVLSFDTEADAPTPADDNVGDNVVLDFNEDEIKKAG